MSSNVTAKGTINLTRGDSFYAKIKLYDQDNDPIALNEGDTLRFALKEEYEDAEPILTIDIPISSMTLRIAPEDTKDLAFGTYVYDIEVTFANGDVDTVIPRKTFNILEEVV